MGASHELIKSYNVGKIIINSYEDNYLAFGKKDLETEDEIFNRLFIDVKDKYEKLLENKNELEELNRRKQKLQDEITKIKKQIKETWKEN